MNRNTKIAVFALLAILIVSVIPASAKFYTKHQTEQFVELAEKAGQKVNNLIENIYVNETALDIIEGAGYLEALEGNVTLYNRGLQNVTYAYTALNMSDYQGAIANATEALQIFREVFKSLNIILEQSGVQKGQLIDAQGLIVAMQRALERIERLREILPENATKAQELLDNATVFLNIDVARTWLLEGRVAETAHNLTQANWLIAQAYQRLKIIAKEMNAFRIRNYLKSATQSMERIMTRLEQAERKGLNVTEILGQLGFENATQFREQLQNMIEATQEKIDQIKNIIQELNQIHNNLQNMERNLKQLEQQHNNGNGNNKP
jgi:methylphosphotriester-DNA--protein-cysteine methyltransferase